MYANLREFVAALDRAGELKRIAAPVSPVLEIAEITDRVSKSPAPNPPSQSARQNDPQHCELGGSALLFENVEGSDNPVLINAFGSYRRVEMALGCPSTPGSPSTSGMEVTENTPDPSLFSTEIEPSVKFATTRSRSLSLSKSPTATP